MICQATNQFYNVTLRSDHREEAILRWRARAQGPAMEKDNNTVPELV